MSHKFTSYFYCVLLSKNIFQSVVLTCTTKPVHTAVESLQPYLHRMEVCVCVCVCVCGEEATREEVLTEHWCSSQGWYQCPL